MKPATTLNDHDLAYLIDLVRVHWPELRQYEKGVATLALNRVQAIAEREGVAAITPLRLAGLRELIEDYIVPFAEIERTRSQPAAVREGGSPS